MAVEVFGVTATTLRQHCFPRLSNFSALSSPTSTIVGEKISVAAAQMYAALAREEIDGDTVYALGSSDVSYIICADIIRKAAALSLRIPSDDPTAAEGWQKEVAAFYALLAEDPAAALANADLSTAESDADGPTHHIDEYGIDIGDTDDASSAEPDLRRDDEL
jgi:uncharacterized protein YbjT (DUF2867 family)